MDDTTRDIRIRRGGPADAPAVLRMLDDAGQVPARKVSVGVNPWRS